MLLRLTRVGAFALCAMMALDAPADDLRTRTEAAAAAAERKAEATEPAEGRQNLVDDAVDVKLERGKPVIEQTGEASYYGKRFHGRRTASGERYDAQRATAAHPTLPLGTEATVTNLETGKQVLVEINDRGPYARGRDLDLSRKAAEQIGLGKDGVAPVEIEARLPSKK